MMKIHPDMILKETMEIAKHLEVEDLQIRNSKHK